MYYFQIFLISSASTRSLTVLFFIVPIFGQNAPLIPIFLKRSLVFPLLLFSSIIAFFFFFFPFIFISWRLIILQYYSGFCHTLTWISHGVTCIPHPDPPSYLPLYPITLYAKQKKRHRCTEQFWTLWKKARVECFKRTASKHAYYLWRNRSPAQVGCMRQVLGPGALFSSIIKYC